jgi:chemotaxis protein methyltransferase CheR
MPPGKKTMLESRLGKRLRALGMNSYKDYEEYLFNIKGMEIEIPHLIDAVTTNKTDFFREANHFEILYNKLLPHWFARHDNKRVFSVWSAGCSSGEEPYTIAIVLNEFAEKNSGFRFSILGTDISNEILEKAQRAVYHEDRIDPVPNNLKKKYFLRSKDRKQKLVRVVPELRNQVAFRLLNFMDDFSFRETMDVIFCRNVVIYFEKPVQERLFQKFCEHLHPNGHIFIGHSETLAGMSLPLKQLSPTVYQKS